VPDLRYLNEAQHGLFAETVLSGLRVQGGMPRFDDQLDAESVRHIEAWILERARIAAAKSAD
jgi:hypothetical protein